MMKSRCQAPLALFQDLSGNESSYQVGGDAFLFSFLPKSICLLHKEGSEPVIITHHALGSMKVTFSNTSLGYVVAAVNII